MKVLLVEDENNLLELATQSLEKAGFTVDTATDGQTAFDKAQSISYDLILLDIKLPQKNGFDVIAQMRALGNNTPILVVSNCADVADRVHGLNLGADDYLVKNGAMEELVARCFAVVRRQHHSRRNILKCKDIVINFDDMSVYRGGKLVQLSKKELGILIELVRNKNRIVSRRDIVEKVWGDRDMPVTSNTIDVHIRTLRNKIDRPFGPTKPVIHTIRGFGYTMRS